MALDWNCAGAAWSFPVMAKTATDENGRFGFKDASPSRGAFSMTVRAPGLQTTSVPVVFGTLPLTIPLKAGLKLSGRVLEAKSGRPVMFAPVTARNHSGNNWREEQSQTDALGNFIFDSLMEGDCQVYVIGADNPGVSKLYKAGQTESVVLKVTPIPAFGLRLAESANPASGQSP